MKKLSILITLLIIIACSKPKVGANEIHFSQNNNLPIVTLDINGHYIRLLVDTGATLNVLDKSLQKKLRFSTRESGQVFEGIGGSRYAEDAYNITTKYKDSIIEIDYITLDISNINKAIGVQGIIGSGFLEKNGYKIDFKENKLVK